MKRIGFAIPSSGTVAHPQLPHSIRVYAVHAQLLKAREEFLSRPDTPKPPSSAYVNAMIGLEHQIFVSHGIGTFSTKSKIQKQIFRRFQTRHCGMVFIHEKMFYAPHPLPPPATTPLPFSPAESPSISFPLQESIESFASALEQLQRNNFMVVLYRNAEIYPTELPTALSQYFDTTILDSAAFPKSMSIAYAIQFVIDSFKTNIRDAVYLIDSTPEEVAAASQYSIRLFNTQPISEFLTTLLPPTSFPVSFEGFTPVADFLERDTRGGGSRHGSGSRVGSGPLHGFERVRDTASSSFLYLKSIDEAHENSSVHSEKLIDGGDF